jgi:hypothetical protein
MILHFGALSALPTTNPTVLQNNIMPIQKK